MYREPQPKGHQSPCAGPNGGVHQDESFPPNQGQRNEWDSETMGKIRIVQPFRGQFDKGVVEKEQEAGPQ